MRKSFNVSPEKIAFAMMAGICLLALIVSFCFTNRCVNCHHAVNTAFCSMCGTQNEKFVELVIENKTGLMCPVCEIERHTPFCGDCGSERVFVEPVDAVSGG